MKLLTKTTILIIIVTSFAMSTLSQEAVPDFSIPRIVVDNTGDGKYISKVRVVVSNNCKKSGAAGSYLLLTFSETYRPDSKKLYYIGNNVAPIAGEKSTTVTFNVPDRKLPADTFIRAEVDPYNNLYEGSEDNNWATYSANNSPPSKSAPSVKLNCTPKF